MKGYLAKLRGSTSWSFSYGARGRYQQTKARGQARAHTTRHANREIREQQAD